MVPAAVQDRDTLPALDRGKAAWPSLRGAVYDGAFMAERCHAWSNLHGMRHHVVERDPAAKGLSSSPGGGWWSALLAGWPTGMAHQCHSSGKLRQMSFLTRSVAANN